MKITKTDQAGVVSFITVMFLASILVLITTGFVRVMASNQRQSLDSQLSTQAYYAAESGVNLIMSLIRNGQTSGLNFNNHECSDGIDFLSGQTPAITNQLDSSVPISITCLMVDDENGAPPLSPVTFNLNLDHSNFYQLKPATGTINRVQITWGYNNQTSSAADTTALVPQGSWRANRPPALRVTVYYPGSDLTRDNLNSSQKTYFLMPISGSNDTIDQSNGDGSVTGISCSSGQSGCVAWLQLNSSVWGAAAPPGGIVDGLFVKITPLYIAPQDSANGNNSVATISAFNGIGHEQTLKGAQYTIDATGRANDVYRRIKVTFDAFSNNAPDNVLESGNDLCKQFEAWPGGSNDPHNCLAP